MNLNKYLLFFLLITTAISFSQEKIKHKVKKGETVYGIAKNYQVHSAEIIRLNPKSKKGLKPNTILIIPKNEIYLDKNSEDITHEVLPKQTLYGIAKLYSVDVEDLKKVNPSIGNDGLKVGSKIIIPSSKIKSTKSEVVKEAVTEVKEVVLPQGDLIHEVQAKETKYGISRKYGITIAELESLNPNIKNDLAIGTKLIVKRGEGVTSSIESANPKNETVKIAETEIKTATTNNQDSTAVKTEEVATTEVIATLEVPPLSADNLTKAEFLIQKASQNIGARYRSGATGNGGFDCSGLVFATYKNLDIVLPRSSRDMATGAGVTINRNLAQKGDLIFFTTNGRGSINHVGLITEVLEEEIKFIHASVHAGVIISSTKEPYYSKRFVKINRVLVNEIKTADQ